MQAAGKTIYTLANVQSGAGNNRYVAWSLVVAYTDPSEPPRKLTIFAGFAIVNSGSLQVSFPASGFLPPPSGPVNTRLDTVGGESDLGFYRRQLYG